jgi:hypothetical protein
MVKTPAMNSKAVLKMINDHKENSTKELNEVRKSIQDLDEKVTNMDEKLSKDIEILKKKSKGSIRSEKLHKFS